MSQGWTSSLRPDAPEFVPFSARAQQQQQVSSTNRTSCEPVGQASCTSMGDSRDTMLGKRACKAAPPVLSLPDLPAAALSAIHDALVDRDQEGFCVYPQSDAAAFRCTCKTLRHAILLPSMLKLSFPIDWAVDEPDSLVALLSRPMSAHTLSLRLTDSVNFSGTYNEDDGRDELFDAIRELGCLGTWLHSLFIPCRASIADYLVFTAHHTPRLQQLVLDLDQNLDGIVERYYGFPGQTDIDIDSPSNYRRKKDNENKDMRSSQLRTLVLRKSPGSFPFVLAPSEDDPSKPGEPILDLSCMPALSELVISGPIVKGNSFASSGWHPFILPPYATVVIDPALGGRKPTPWARPLTTYNRFDAMPPSAIPSFLEYKDEDHLARLECKKAFKADVYKSASNVDDGPLYLDALHTFMDECLSDEGLDRLMSAASCFERYFLLLQGCLTFFTASHILRSYKEGEDPTTHYSEFFQRCLYHFNH